MLSGFNTNIRHRAVLFHVQSEDSGRDHPHIITHLYHGGTILVSEKSSYADRLGEADLAVVVKELMERQHKVVLKRLVGGDFDALLSERLGAGIFADDARPTASLESDAGTPTQPGVAGRASGPVDSGPPPAAEEESSFGSGIVSEKPLDEVILDYLIESARKRKRRK
jgi:hypothetical protein